MLKRDTGSIESAASECALTLLCYHTSRATLACLSGQVRAERSGLFILVITVSVSAEK